MHDPGFLQTAQKAGRQIHYASGVEMIKIINAATDMEKDIEALFTKAIRGEL